MIHSDYIRLAKEMLENATPLPVKAAGGICTTQEVIDVIKLSVKRIGTSNQKAILFG